jgi:hypothetical protein
MPDYSKSKIYRICSNETEYIYIGSTTQDIQVRFNEHKSCFNRHSQGKQVPYCSSFKILQYSTARVELVEEFPCEIIEQLRVREGFWIQSSTTCVNTQVAGRTRLETINSYLKNSVDKRKEYRELHKDVILEQKKQWYLNAKEKLHSYHVCDICGKKYQYSHKVRHTKSKFHLAQTKVSE